MHTSSHTPRLLAAIAGAALVSTLAAADITTYAAARYVSYTQTSDAPPAAPETWAFSALIGTDLDNEIFDASVSFDRPPSVTIRMYQSHPMLMFYGSDYYTDYSQYILDFPATTYTFSADRGVGPEIGELFLPEDQFCAEVPALTGDTFTRMQTLDSTIAFDGTINGFTPALGTNMAATYLSVVQDRVPAITWSAELLPGDTAFQIPAGVLLPGTRYSIGITYLNYTQTPEAGFTAAISSVEFLRGTGAAFATTQSCDHFVEEFEVAVPCIGDGQPCGNAFDVAFDTCGLLKAEFFVAPTHCSPIELRFLLDGGLVYTTPTLNANDYTGLLDFGPVAPGPHTLSIEAIGSEGGCNAGILESWGGTLRLHRCAAPTELDGPYDGLILCGSDGTSFRVNATGGGPYAYQWEAQLPGDPGVWVTLADGDVPDVGTVLGAATDTLYINHPTSPGLLFRCIATNGCSTTISNEALLTLQDCNPCPADFNQDGGIDGADVQAFFAAWEGGDTAADVNFDGGIDGADVETFFAAWESGGC